MRFVIRKVSNLWVSEPATNTERRFPNVKRVHILYKNAPPTIRFFVFSFAIEKRLTDGSSLPSIAPACHIRLSSFRAAHGALE